MIINNYELYGDCLKSVVIDKVKFYSMINDKIFALKVKKIEKTNAVSIIASSLRHYLFFKTIFEKNYNLTNDNPLFFQLIFLLTDLMFTKRNESNSIRDTIIEACKKAEFSVPGEEVFLTFMSDTPKSILAKVFNNETVPELTSARYNIPLWLLDMWRKQYEKEFANIIRNISSKHKIYCKVNSKINVDNISLATDPDYRLDKSGLYEYIGKTSFKKVPAVQSNLVYETCGVDQYITNCMKVKPEQKIVLYANEKNSLFFDLLSKFNKENTLYFFSKDFTRLSKYLEFVRKNKHDRVFYAQTDIEGLEARLPDKADIFYFCPTNSDLAYLNVTPEYLINFDNESLNSIIEEQKKSLNIVKKIVVEDGYLVYFNHTLDKKESERMIEDFLSANKNYLLIDQKTFFPTFIDNNFGYYAILKRIY